MHPIDMPLTVVKDVVGIRVVTVTLAGGGRIPLRSVSIDVVLPTEATARQYSQHCVLEVRIRSTTPRARCPSREVCAKARRPLDPDFLDIRREAQVPLDGVITTSVPRGATVGVGDP